jgi:hypothetical protein
MVKPPTSPKRANFKFRRQDKRAAVSRRELLQSIHDETVTRNDAIANLPKRDEEGDPGVLGPNSKFAVLRLQESTDVKNSWD